MKTLTPAQYEALERAYERDDYKVTGSVQTLHALHARGLVTEPVYSVPVLSHAYLTTAGLDLIESGG